jgi:hypothetical protein
MIAFFSAYRKAWPHPIKIAIERFGASPHEAERNGGEIARAFAAMHLGRGREEPA